MLRITQIISVVILMALVPATAQHRTTVSFEGEAILINGEPTLKGVLWNGISMEGLLPNSRMVQGIFDDLNAETIGHWNYPDTGTWNPERNTDEFVGAMESWRAHGLLGFTVNLQGGSPFGYSNNQPWHNSAIDSNGGLRPAYMTRLKKVMDRSNQLGMVTILGIFYFGQDERLTGESAVKRAVVNMVNWLHDQDYRNVLIEIANECDNRKYEMAIIKSDRVHELIQLAQSVKRDGYSYPVSTSYNGNTIPGDNVIEVADYLLLHGNGVKEPARIAEMVKLARQSPAFTPKPIIFNEDDHYDFDQPMNNMVAAFKSGASWGFFDYRRDGEAYEAGFQSVPVDWGIGHERKKAFFELLKGIAGMN